MENFKELLKNEVKKYNDLELTDDMLNKFEEFKKILLEWNENVNLTAITDEHQIILKHFVDSLEIVKYIDEGKKIIDIGTGAGFPGIVIAIYFGDKVDITLVDALDKRIKFLEVVVKKLELKNVELIHGRAEEIANNANFREKYDIATARAVSSLNILLELNVPFLKKNGICLFLKGDKVEDEIIKSKKALEILNCKINENYRYIYMVNDEEYKRYILLIKKNQNTSSKYPRIYSKIKKNPL